MGIKTPRRISMRFSCQEREAHGAVEQPKRVKAATLEDAHELMLDYWLYGLVYVNAEGKRVDPRLVRLTDKGLVYEVTSTMSVSYALRVTVITCVHEAPAYHPEPLNVQEPTW